MANTRIKPLRPSLREKKRYLIFEVISKEKVDQAMVSQAIWDGCLKFLGELGMAKAGILILSNKWNERSQRGMIRIAHTQTENIKQALTLIRSVGKTEAIIEAKGVSGAINKAEHKFLLKNLPA